MAGFKSGVTTTLKMIAAHLTLHTVTHTMALNVLFHLLPSVEFCIHVLGLHGQLLYVARFQQSLSTSQSSVVRALANKCTSGFGLDCMFPVVFCIALLVVSGDETLHSKVRCLCVKCRRSDDWQTRAYNIMVLYSIAFCML